MKDVGSRAIEMKVVMVGDIGVGKTSVAARFIRNQFKENGQSTIGASYMWKECLVKDQKLKFAVWDTAGQEQYHSLVPMYFRSAAAVVLVFDVTNPKTLESAITWEEQIRTNAPANVIVALVGNKCDLSERAVSEEDIENVKEKSKADLAFECSAKVCYELNISSSIKKMKNNKTTTDISGNLRNIRSNCSSPSRKERFI